MRHGDKPGPGLNKLVGLEPGLLAEDLEQASGRLDGTDHLLEGAGPNPLEGDPGVHRTTPLSRTDGGDRVSATFAPASTSHLHCERPDARTIVYALR